MFVRKITPTTNDLVFLLHSVCSIIGPLWSLINIINVKDCLLTWYSISNQRSIEYLTHAELLFAVISAYISNKSRDEQ